MSRPGPAVAADIYLAGGIGLSKYRWNYYRFRFGNPDHQVAMSSSVALETSWRLLSRTIIPHFERLTPRDLPLRC